MPLYLGERLALLAGQSIRLASRLLGRGSGGMIGGIVAYNGCENVADYLARGKKIVLVTGTNGKSTTTHFTSAALSTLGEVACNNDGHNILAGGITTLLTNRKTEYFAIEIDELHFPNAVKHFHPSCIILLNLTRDQLDRMGEVSIVERKIREAITACPDAYVVANCDDPMIVSAAWDAPKVCWVSVGCNWVNDSVSFPRDGKRVIREGKDWYVQDSIYRRPQPDWEVREGKLYNCKTEEHLDLQINLPGEVNYGNGAQALLAAHLLGADLQAANHKLASIKQVAGRYSTAIVGKASWQLFLAKNPAGWLENLRMIPTCDALVFAVNGREADSHDLSWIWDVDFEQLQDFPAPIVACGERGVDLAVRLSYAGIPCTLADTPWEACSQFPEGKVTVLANYSAFHGFKNLLQAKGLIKNQ